MYQIKGKIDTTNAPAFEKEIMEAKPTEIDASGLEYISSAGLRVLMKLRKTVDSVTVYNVKPEVMRFLSCCHNTENHTRTPKAKRFGGKFLMFYLGNFTMMTSNGRRP